MKQKNIIFLKIDKLYEEEVYRLENHDIVKVIINKWDPLNLFPGAPDDEYDVEINKIIISMSTTESAKELAKEIQVIFQEAFNQEFDNTKCLIIASEIWIAVKNNASK